MTFGPCQANSKTAITLNPESSPREESFPIPLQYIDVSRTTHTNLDVMQESRIDDYWNTDGSRDLSICGPGRDWQNGKQTIYGQSSGEEWQGMLSWGRHKWSNEKPKLDNARKLRGIYFIDFKDEFKETMWNARRKLETPKAPAMPCKTCKKSKHGETRSKTNDFKSKCACILEASESTRMRMEESLPKYHEDHIAGKGGQFIAALQFGTQIYSHASSNEDTRSKSSRG